MDIKLQGWQEEILEHLKIHDRIMSRKFKVEKIFKFRIYESDNK